MRDPTQRFSTRVENYLRYRPSYPAAALDHLAGEGALRPGLAVADVGSGTGRLTELLLRRGAEVWAVEPNREMREAAERLLAGWPGLHSLDGRAESTGLPDRSVDLVTAAQAFHWFDRPLARREFRRILRPGGWVALLWNDRLTSATAFLEEYEDLLRRYSPDYGKVDHRRIDAALLGEFFAPEGYREAVFENRQDFDFAGLRGRLFSSSYMPEPDDPASAPLLRELEEVFARHQREGRVGFLYRTQVFYAQWL